MKDLQTLKKDREEKLAKFRVNFRFFMGFAEIFAPILIQAIPALLTVVSIGLIFPTLLHIPVLLAWILAAFVGIGAELLGLVATDVYFESRAYNQTRKETEEKAPEGTALFVMLVYAATSLLIVVFLKMFPSLAIWSLIPLTLMSILIVSAATMKKRLDEIICAREKEVAKKDLQEMANSNLQKLQEKVAEEELRTKNLQERVAEEEINAKKLRDIVAAQDLQIKNLQEKLAGNQFAPATTQEELKLHQQKVAENKNTKNNSLQKIIDYLVQNYDGVATEDIDHAKVATDLQIHRTTVTRNIEKLQGIAKLNGHVNKELLIA